MENENRFPEVMMLFHHQLLGKNGARSKRSMATLGRVMIATLALTALASPIRSAAAGPHEAARTTQLRLAAPSARVRFISIERNVRLEVLDWGGSGRAVVFLAASGCTAHEFDDFAPKLTNQYHVYGITRRGFGNSGFALGEYGADLLGNDVLKVIDTLGLKRPVLVGHSFAGEELSSIATRYPDRIAGLVYLEAAYPYAFDNGKGMSMAEFQKVVRGPQPPSPGARDLVSFPALQNYYRRIYGFTLPESELRQEWITLPNGRIEGRRKFPGSAILMRGTKNYTNIPVPALIIFANPHRLGPWFERNTDPMVAAQTAAYLAQFQAFTAKQERAIRDAVPSAHVITITGANHFVFITNEAHVLRDMRAFLATLDAR
jgi:pimeloyl-ACP methyl ester carboxylesterase